MTEFELIGAILSISKLVITSYKDDQNIMDAMISIRKLALTLRDGSTKYGREIDHYESKDKLQNNGNK